MNAMGVFFDFLVGFAVLAEIYIVVVLVRNWRVGRRIDAAGVLIEKQGLRIAEMSKILISQEPGGTDADSKLKEKERLKRYLEFSNDVEKGFSQIDNILMGIGADQANVWKIWKKIL